ncbi:MAG: zinc ribbon domain-containing protein [Actinobacteria bacterium]|nr:zinc ribbon domain-containing protein [Actinomycetota bacterium]
MGGLSSLFTVYIVGFSMDQYFRYAIFPPLGIVIAFLFAAIFWKLGKKAGLNHQTLAIPGFFSVWALMNGYLLEDSAGTAVTLLGAFGLLSVMVIFTVLYFLNRSPETNQTGDITFNLNTYPSFTQFEHHVFAPSRQEYENGSVLCGNCSAHVPQHYVACWKCGSFLDKSYFSKTCIVCGKQLPHHAEFCDQCGSRPGGPFAWK